MHLAIATVYEFSNHSFQFKLETLSSSRELARRIPSDLRARGGAQKILAGLDSDEQEVLAGEVQVSGKRCELDGRNAAAAVGIVEQCARISVGR